MRVLLFLIEFILISVVLYGFIRMALLPAYIQLRTQRGVDRLLQHAEKEQETAEKELQAAKILENARKLKHQADELLFKE